MATHHSPGPAENNSKNAITHAEIVIPASPENQKDKAAAFLSAVDENTSFTYEEEKAVRKRIDYRVLPIVLGAYFFQQLDKLSLSYVSVFGITDDAHLDGR